VGIDNSERLKRNKELYRPAKQKWAQENPETIKRSRAKWRENNQEKQNELTRDWERKNKDHVSIRRKAWERNNPDKVKATRRRGKEKRSKNPSHAIADRLRSRINKLIKNGSKSGKKLFELLGYTIEELMIHLESQFLPGMSWDNREEWHIDHIIPLSAFNFETPYDIDFGKAWSLQNLRPLWASDNVRKGAKLKGDFQPSLRLAIPVNDNAKVAERSVDSK